MSCAVILVDVCFCELVVKYLIVSPAAMAFLHAFGWYDVLCMYSCLFVFFVWVFISSMLVIVKLGPLYTIISRNVTLDSRVNLIVGGGYR